MLLPVFGGTSAVWLTSLLFFQVALLLGYLFADASVRRLGPRAQAAAHLMLLALAMGLLPFTLDADARVPAALAHAAPLLQLLALLSRSVGLPFIALAATGPIAQALWSRTRTGSPYRLYALSNLASLLGLAAYPFLVEPRLTLHAQVRLFVIAFALFALAAAALSLRGMMDGSMISARPGEPAPSSKGPAPSREMEPALDEGTSRRARALWLLLPACTSALLIAITGHLTRNVAPIPLLWMVPLAAYLASFILCFESPAAVSRNWTAPAGLVALGGLAFADSWVPPDTHLAWTIAGLTAAFFLAVTALHAELVRLRPPALGLTRFYLSLSLGGALGSIAVAVLVPLAFRGTVELALSVIISAAALSAAIWPALAGAGRFSLSVRAALVIGIAFMALGLFIATKTRSIGNVFAGRNFYGALHVQDSLGKRGRLRALYNGNTMHGIQLISPAPSTEMLAYYGVGSGVGRALTAQRARKSTLRVGTVGLGAGILAGGCLPGDAFVFYELNPLVAEVARSQFTFLSSCAGTEVRLGDARLLLAKEPPQQFDLLVIDAFNSDSIPVHLLTAEAFALYLKHLAPGGILAVHVSNRYLDLEPAIAAHAAPLALRGRLVIENSERDDVFPNEWVLLSQELGALQGPAFAGARTQAIETFEQVREWTDDYSNIASAFR